MSFSGLRAWNVKDSRRRSHRLLDEGAGKAHAFAAHLGAGVAQDVARLGKHEVHADLFEDLERRFVNGLELVRRYHFEGWKEAHQAAARQLLDGFRRSVSPASAVASAPPGTGAGLRLAHVPVLSADSIR